jgi:signal transduction histidine kinase
LKKSEEALKSANSAKDKLFSVIGHDLKNPMHIILSSSSLALEHFKKENWPKLENHLYKITKNTNISIELLNNLLQWARSQSKGLQVSPKLVSVEDLLTPLNDLLDEMKSRKSIIVEANIDKNATAFADVNMLSTVLRNLLSNAMKFTNKNGNIVISANVIDDKLHLKVKDNGVGISEAALEKLFDPGSNYTSRGTDDEKGTGLGLILCKEFVEKNNGKIEVSSKLNEGTEFTVILPAKDKSI